MGRKGTSIMISRGAAGEMIRNLVKDYMYKLPVYYYYWVPYGTGSTVYTRLDRNTDL